jgi:hypothetical protein
LASGPKCVILPSGGVGYQKRGGCSAPFYFYFQKEKRKKKYEIMYN